MTGLPKRYNLMVNGFAERSVQNFINTESGLTAFLKFMAKEAEMTLITQMTVNIEDHTDGEWYGLSGLAMIATSHIAMHIWPSYDSYYMFDISSCKAYDEDKICLTLERYLGKPCTWKEYVEYLPEEFSGKIIKRIP